MSYLIKNDEIIAIVTEELKRGSEVRYAYRSVRDALSGKEVLVNATYAKVSNAKKWGEKIKRSGWDVPIALMIDNSTSMPDFIIR